MHACNILNKKLIPVKVILFWHKWTNYVHKLVPSGKSQNTNTRVAQIFRFLLWKMYLCIFTFYFDDSEVQNLIFPAD